MKKNILTLCFLIGSCFIANAQKSAKASYSEFMGYRTGKGDESKIKKITALLEQKDQLSVKQVANLQFQLGRMYEDIKDPENALLHYLESIKGEPNYTVIHRAMGFIYLDKTKPIIAEMNEAKAKNNAVANAKAFEKYKVLVKKALPHFEKYQACETDEETQAMISNLYKSIKEPQAITTLPNRLKPLAQNCVTLLEDE